jgi:hypothetical protein
MWPQDPNRKPAPASSGGPPAATQTSLFAVDDPTVVTVPPKTGKPNSFCLIIRGVTGVR